MPISFSFTPTLSPRSLVHLVSFTFAQSSLACVCFSLLGADSHSHDGAAVKANDNEGDTRVMGTQKRGKNVYGACMCVWAFTFLL